MNSYFRANKPEQVSFLLEIMNCLSDTYTNEGIVHWFHERRDWLDGKTAFDVLGGTDWSPQDELPQKIMKKAQSLKAGNFT